MHCLRAFGVVARDREPGARASAAARDRTGHDADVGGLHRVGDLAHEVGASVHQEPHAVRDVHGRSLRRLAAVATRAGHGHAHRVLLALATCRELPAHEADDRPFHAALERRGVAFEHAIWDDDTVDWARYDAVLIRTTWDYTARVGAFCDWARRVEAVTRLANPARVVEWNTHKSYLRALGKAGVATVPTVWLDRGSRPDLAALTTAIGGRVGFLKPCVGATAEGTVRFSFDHAGIARGQAHIDAVIGERDYMLQPFVKSVTSHGETSAMFFGGELSHCVRKVPQAGDYRVQDDYGGQDEPCEPSAAELDLARRAIAAASAELDVDLLYARADWLVDEHGRPRLVELELVEPSLFFRHAPAAADRFADAWLGSLTN